MRDRKPRESLLKLEIAPMIDIAFTLLIFFAVATTFEIHNRGLKLQLPAAYTISTEKKGVVLSIDQNQRLYLDNTPIPLNLLQGKMSEIVKASPESQLILNADQETPYSFVIQVLDEVRLGGMFDIVLEANLKKAL